MPVVDRRYEIGARLGAGGMAEVFEAFDRRLNRRVAIKFLNVHVADLHARERFEHEARALARVDHPNAVAVHDVGEDGDRPYIVLELVEGQSLASRLSRNGPLDAREALGITDHVLAALAAVHGEGLLHRDVKPGNVLCGDDGSVKLADFGVAKTFNDATADLTMTGQVIGTARYLAPEVAAGRPASPQSDLYAVGVMIGDMLAGAAPNNSADGFSLVTAGQRARDPDPDRRFRSAEEMRAALHGAGPTMPVARAAPTEILPTRARPDAQDARRTRRALMAALVVVVVLATAGALIAARHDSSRRAASPATSPPPARTQPASTSPPTKPAATNAPAPQTLQQVVALVGADPARYGSKATELVGRLEQILGAPAGKAHKQARTLAGDVDNWASHGELDPAVAATTVRLLGGLPAASGPHDNEND
jgi:serine/threonine protein kinase